MQHFSFCCKFVSAHPLPIFKRDCYIRCLEVWGGGSFVSDGRAFFMKTSLCFEIPTSDITLVVEFGRHK